MLLSKKVLNWHERQCLTLETSNVSLNSYWVALNWSKNWTLEFDISDLVGLATFPAVSNAYLFIFMFDAPPFLD